MPLPIEILTNGIRENRRLVAEQNAQQNQLPVTSQPQQGQGQAPTDVAAAIVEAVMGQPQEQQVSAPAQTQQAGGNLPLLNAQQLQGFKPPEPVQDGPDSNVLIDLISRLLSG